MSVWLLMAAGADASGHKVVGSGPEATRHAIQNIVAWSEGLRSFDGRFILTRYPDSDPASSARAPKRMQVRYRFQGADRYMEIVDEDIVPSGGRAILSLALLDGKVSQRTEDLKDGALEPLSGQVNLPAWPLPV